MVHRPVRLWKDWIIWSWLPDGLPVLSCHTNHSMDEKSLPSASAGEVAHWTKPFISMHMTPQCKGSIVNFSQTNVPSAQAFCSLRGIPVFAASSLHWSVPLDHHKRGLALVNWFQILLYKVILAAPRNEIGLSWYVQRFRVQEHGSQLTLKSSLAC